MMKCQISLNVNLYSNISNMSPDVQTNNKLFSIDILCSLGTQLIINYKYTNTFLSVASLELTRQEDKTKTIKQKRPTINKMVTAAGATSIINPHK